QLYANYKDRAHLYVIYIREAHPTDGWQVPANEQDKILIADPKTLQERRKVAGDFAAQFKVSLPILVDTLDDQVQKAYAARLDRPLVRPRPRRLQGPRGAARARQAAASAVNRAAVVSVVQANPKQALGCTLLSRRDGRY